MGESQPSALTALITQLIVYWSPASVHIFVICASAVWINNTTIPPAPLLSLYHEYFSYSLQQRGEKFSFSLPLLILTSNIRLPSKAFSPIFSSSLDPNCRKPIAMGVTLLNAELL